MLTMCWTRLQNFSKNEKKKMQGRRIHLPLFHQQKQILYVSAKYSLTRPRPRLNVSTPESRLLLKNHVVTPQRSLYCFYVSVCYPKAGQELSALKHRGREESPAVSGAHPTTTNTTAAATNPISVSSHAAAATVCLNHLRRACPL